MPEPILQPMPDPRDPHVLKRPADVIVMPQRVRDRVVLPRRDVARNALACQDALLELRERYGLTAFLVAVRYLLNADGVNTAEQTIDDLAQGSEEL